MQKTRSRTIETPIGFLTLEAGEDGLTAIRFSDGQGKDEDGLLLETQRQLEEYFAGRRKRFDVPLAPEGTPFQKRVWEELSRIPYGETVTYGGVARAVGSPKACRAVGMANHVNPIPIIVPCHRVVGSNGKLTGYAGGLGVKQFLLDLEGKWK